MASSLEFVQYAADQMRDAGEITYKKMFGEYGIYCNGKVIGVICENQLFVKVTEAGRRLCPDLDEAAPYTGARPHLLVEDVDDRELLGKLASATFDELPMPRPKTKKNGKKEEKSSSDAVWEGVKIDFKKRDKTLYQPTGKPVMIEVPEMTFLTVEGEGNPNTSADYQKAVEALYSLSYTIKMSKKRSDCPPGYFDYVVPPLEGLWMTNANGFDGKIITDKNQFRWISMIRQPDFVTEEVFEQAKRICGVKMPEVDLSKIRLIRYEEGLCAQVMHTGSFDDEPGTVELLNRFIEDNGYMTDITDKRWHHEIYMRDPRKTAAGKMKTVIRHPVKKRT